MLQAANKRTSAGCALFWFDFLSMTLLPTHHQAHPTPSATSSKATKQLKLEVPNNSKRRKDHHGGRHHHDSSTSAKKRNESTSIPDDIHRRWWPSANAEATATPPPKNNNNNNTSCRSSSLRSYAFDKQPEAVTVARVALAIMYPEEVEAKCGARMKSAGFFAATKHNNVEETSSSSSSTSSSSSSSLIARVQPSVLVTVLELYCRRYTCATVPQQEKSIIREVFWRAAAYVSYRAVELDAAEVTRALSVISEMPLPLTTPTAARSGHVATKDDVNVEHGGDGGALGSSWDAPISVNSGGAHRASAAVTPRSICAYLSCHARFTARRFNAIYAAKAVTELARRQQQQQHVMLLSPPSKPLDATTDQHQHHHHRALGAMHRDVSLLGRRAIADGRHMQYPTLHNTVEEAARVFAASSVVGCVGIDKGTLEFSYSSSRKLGGDESSKAQRTIPWSLLPPPRAASAAVDSVPRSQNKIFVDDDDDVIVGKAMLVQLIKKRPVCPFSAAVASTRTEEESPLLTSHSSIFFTRGEAEATAAGRSMTASTWGPTDRRRALIARAEKLLMFQAGNPSSALSSSSSSATSTTSFKKWKSNRRKETRNRNRSDGTSVTAAPTSLKEDPLSPRRHLADAQSHTAAARNFNIWSTVGGWADIFAQLSPMARNAMLCAATASLATTSLVASQHRAQHHQPSFHALAASGSFFIPQMQTLVARAALRHAATSGGGVVSTAAATVATSVLTKTIHGLGVADIIPKLALTSSLPRSALDLCSAQLLGRTVDGMDEMEPFVALHTRSVISPSPQLRESLRAVRLLSESLNSSNNNNNNKTSGGMKPLPDDHCDADDDDDAAVDHELIENDAQQRSLREHQDQLTKRRVLLACTNMLLQALEELYIKHDNMKTTTRTTTHNNDSSRSVEKEVVHLRHRFNTPNKARVSDKEAAREFLTRVSAIPVLLTAAVAGRRISDTHAMTTATATATAAAAGGVDDLRRRLKSLKLALFHSATMAPDLDLFLLRSSGKNHDAVDDGVVSARGGSSFRTQNAHILRRLLEAEQGRDVTAAANDDDAENLFGGTASNDVVVPILQRVNAIAESSPVEENTGSPQARLSPSTTTAMLRQAHIDFIRGAAVLVRATSDATEATTQLLNSVSKKLNVVVPSSSDEKRDTTAMPLNDRRQLAASGVLL